MYRVLLVEDEPLILEGLCMATPWARYGCTVAGKAYNAEEAERLIVELRPDIVITDINMPGGSGLELIERMKGRCGCEFIILSGYDQFEYAKKELTHLFAATDLIISRAGANAICELLALKKPNILIPLPASQSRGDQLLNAASFEKSGYSYVLQEEELTSNTLLKAVQYVYDEREEYIQTLKESKLNRAIPIIMNLIKKYS